MTLLRQITASSLFLAMLQMPLHAADRIAVAGGSITEIIYRLGEEQRIVGVDSTSTYKNADETHPLLGYVRSISVEGVLSLSPDLLIGENDTGPSKALEQVAAVGLTTAIIEEDGTLASIPEKIRHVARLLGVQDKGENLVNEIQVDIDALSFASTQLKASSIEKPKVLFLLTLRNGTPIAAGSQTSANTTILEAGGENAIANEKGWVKLSPEAALAFNPDVIVVMNHHDAPYEAVKKLAHFKYTNAVKNKAVYSIDGGYLLGFGPRTPQAIIELGTMIYADYPLPNDYQFRYDNNAKNSSEHGS
ncbi:heme/hemin ABC transporter substrate-binding protein [Marinomonas dokdonensis]|uniref:heme/hemin ABC transporter substrate-binding protein n=1 Tax=Marinomonas dokdonensis TaxID=328224 RepID=UPI00405599C0